MTDDKNSLPVLWHVAEFADEVASHGPTLTEAAAFLQAGEHAKHGETVALMGLRVLCESTAYLSEPGADWVFDPPVPDGADFSAIRYGPGAGWSADSITNPQAADFNTTFTEAVDASFMFDAPDGRIEMQDVVFAKHIAQNAVYLIGSDGVATLTLLDALRPCPFCYAQERVYLQPREFGERELAAVRFAVTCETCGACAEGVEWTHDGQGAPGFTNPGAAVAAWNQRGTGSEALEDIALERHRQIIAEGFSRAADDNYQDGELAMAAACYAYRATHVYFANPEPPAGGQVRWPWARDWWKPKDRRADLVRAGALILAEIERLDRMAGA